MDRSRLPEMVRKSTPINIGKKKAKKKVVRSGSYSKKRRKGYEDMLKEAGN